MENYTEQELIRREKAEKLRELGIDPFGSRYDATHKSSDIKNIAVGKTNEVLEEEKNIVKIAGRIMFIRKMGKASFFSIKDIEGLQQVYISINDIGEDSYNLFKMADVGDIVGVKGMVMLTKTGEPTVKCIEYTHLTKALKPLPEKFHGLTDKEERYRRRYVDLIMNDEARKIALTRPRIIRAMQGYFDNMGFIEVETPVLTNIQGGATARPFITHHNTLDTDFYLRIATELPLKRLIVGGLERVYEFGRLFRNEGMDLTHNPEFTTVELYQAYGDLASMMELQEGVLRHICETVTGKYEYINIFNPEGEKIDLSKPFRKASRIEGDPMMLDDFDHEVNEGLMQSLLEIMDQYSDEKVMEFMANAFKDNQEIDVKKIPVKSVEDFIMVILGTVKSDSRYSFYNYVRPENVERITKQDKYEMPNYSYVKKGE